MFVEVKISSSTKILRYRIVGNFRWVKFSLWASEKYFRGLIFVCTQGHTYVTAAAFRIITTREQDSKSSHRHFSKFSWALHNENNEIKTQQIFPTTRYTVYLNYHLCRVQVNDYRRYSVPEWILVNLESQTKWTGSGDGKSVYLKWLSQTIIQIPPNNQRMKRTNTSARYCTDRASIWTGTTHYQISGQHLLTLNRLRERRRPFASCGRMCSENTLILCQRAALVWTS